MNDFPVLRIRATDPLRVTELTLDGIDLRQLRVNAIRLDMSAGNPTEATLTFHVMPDIELPAEVQALLVRPDAEPPPDLDPVLLEPDPGIVGITASYRT